MNRQRFTQKAGDQFGSPNTHFHMLSDSLQQSIRDSKTASSDPLAIGTRHTLAINGAAFSGRVTVAIRSKPYKPPYYDAASDPWRYKVSVVFSDDPRVDVGDCYIARSFELEPK